MSNTEAIQDLERVAGSLASDKSNEWPDEIACLTAVAGLLRVTESEKQAHFEAMNPDAELGSPLRHEIVATLAEVTSDEGDFIFDLRSAMASLDAIDGLITRHVEQTLAERSQLLGTVLTEADTTDIVNDALFDLDEDSSTWPTGEQVEAIVDAVFRRVEPTLVDAVLNGVPVPVELAYDRDEVCAVCPCTAYYHSRSGTRACDNNWSEAAGQDCGCTGFTSASA